MPGRAGGRLPSPVRTRPISWLPEVHGRPGAASSRFPPVMNQQDEATPRPGGAAYLALPGLSEQLPLRRLLRWPSWFSANWDG